MTTGLLPIQSSLAELDFPAPCGHSRHNDGGPGHAGDAEYIAVSYHECPGTGHEPAPWIYPCCATWAEWVLAHSADGASVMCARCGTRGYWSEMVQIVSTL
jgi:hypothetical protein